jgi:hypothetical protein
MPQDEREPPRAIFQHRAGDHLRQTLRGIDACGAIHLMQRPQILRLAFQ